MAEKIGLEAVLDLGNFSRGLAEYTSGISKMTSQTATAASQLSGQFVGLGQGVLKFGAIAGGVALAGVAALGAGFTVLGAQALDEYAKYERLSLSLTSLVAREISQGKEVEQQRQVVAQLTAKEAEEVQNLSMKIQEEGLERQTMLGRIQEQRQRVIDLTAAYGEQGLNVQTAKAKLAEMEFELTKSDAATAKMTARINELNSKNGQLITVIDKVRVGQMSMGDAMAQASPKAQDLLKWIQLLAIQSPFNQEGIANAFRTAMAYGFTTDEAKRLTQAEVDFASATGKSVEATGLIALALGQMQAKGKVSGQELIQLTNAGIGVNAILASMGYTLDDVSKGLVSSDKFIEAVITDMEVFKGAAKDQSATFSGLISTLGDLKAVGLREFFAGTFIAIQPYLADFVDWLTKISIETGGLRAIGDVLGTNVASALQKISNLVASFQTGGTAGLMTSLGISPEAQQLIGLIITDITSLGETINTSLIPSLTKLSEQVMPVVNDVLSFMSEHWTEIKGAIAGVLLVLAGSAIFAIVAGLIASLASPIMLIIGLAGLLGAAWTDNWGGIRDIVTSVVTTVEGGWPAISAALSEWGTKFMDWVAKVYPQIPTKLTEIVNGIYNGLVAGWDIIAPALATWIPKFWDWATQATANATTSLAGILAAIYTWATSPEAGASLQRAGEQIGKMVVEGVALLFQDSGSVGPVLRNLVTGLGVGIAGIAGSLIAIGGQIVAGIAKGIANSFGADLQVWTFSDLQNYANWLVTGVDWAAVGSGILSLIGEGWDSMISGFQEKVKTFNEGVKQFFIDTWNSIYMTLLGNSIVWDIVNGIVDAFTGLPAKLASVFGVGGLIGALFGGGEAATGEGVAGGFDILGIVTNFTQAKTIVDSLNLAITNLSTITLPMLSTAMSTLAPAWITQFTLIQTGVSTLDLTLQNLGLVTLPALILAATTLATGWATQTTTMQQSTMALDTSIQTIAASLVSLGTAATTAGQAMVSGFSRVPAAIQNILRVVNSLSTLVSQLKQIATQAADGVVVSFTEIDWSEIGRGIGEGIAEGLESKQGTIVDLAREVAKAALDAAKEELGISSPSQEFYNIGLDTINGMIIGFDEGRPILMRTITETMRKAMLSTKELVGMMSIEVWADFMSGMSGFASYFTGELSNQAQEIDKGIQANQDIVAKSLESLSKQLGKEISYQDVLDMAMTGDLSNIDDPITQAITQAIDAQTELNNQTNEYLALQEQITRQQQEQQQLKFLQQQIDLLAFIDEYKLSADKILQGITLGAEASVEDLANATSNVVQAMIARLNTQLVNPDSVNYEVLQQPHFQSGTYGSTVPPNYPNDTYQVGLTSGEEFMVAPRGTSLDSMAMARVSDMLQSNVSRGAVGGRSVQVIFNNTQINNGMDLANLGSFVRQEVARAI